jgi:hypothetical protein
MSKAGHARAFAALSRTLVHYRCPQCLLDVRTPDVDEAGVHCPYCGNVDGRRAVTLEQRPIAGGFRWVARLDPPNKT